jgi:hypothetical protein
MEQQFSVPLVFITIFSKKAINKRAPILMEALGLG